MSTGPRRCSCLTPEKHAWPMVGPVSPRSPHRDLCTKGRSTLYTVRRVQRRRDRRQHPSKNPEQRSSSSSQSSVAVHEEFATRVLTSVNDAFVCAAGRFQITHVSTLPNTAHAFGAAPPLRRYRNPLQLVPESPYRRQPVRCTIVPLFSSAPRTSGRCLATRWRCTRAAGLRFPTRSLALIVTRSLRIFPSNLPHERNVMTSLVLAAISTGSCPTHPGSA